MKSLSICIPIYNFGKFVGETLNSIIPQIQNDEIEIIVLDGGSTDNTRDILATYQHLPYLRYIRMNERGGIDQDMALTISFARGTYCWLFSGDDLMCPGAIPKILQEIKTGCDLYLCSFSIHSPDMKKTINSRYPIFKKVEDSL